MSVTEYLDAQRDYRNYDPMGNSMSMEESMERTENEHKLHARHRDDLSDQSANLAANVSGHRSRARDLHEFYTSGSSHDRGDSRGAGRDEYEESHDNESADGSYGRPGARPKSRTASTYPPEHRDINYPTDVSTYFEESTHRHGVPPSAPRDGKSLKGLWIAQSLLTATSSHHYESQQDAPSTGFVKYFFK